jgi:hypothetical protein
MPRHFWTARTTESGVTGVLRTHAARMPVTSRFAPVTITTGMAEARSNTAKPSIPGSIGSRTTTSGVCSSISRSADVPSAASRTVNPARDSAIETKRRKCSSSSTTSTPRVAATMLALAALTSSPVNVCSSFTLEATPIHAGLCRCCQLKMKPPSWRLVAVTWLHGSSTGPPRQAQPTPYFVGLAPEMDRIVVPLSSTRSVATCPVTGRPLQADDGVRGHVSLLRRSGAGESNRQSEGKRNGRLRHQRVWTPPAEHWL